MNKQCQNCKQDFLIEPEDFEFYNKISVPAPTFCPECRMVRRFMWRNERNLFKRPDLLGKTVFSMFPADAPFKIYDREYWWSDSWDAMDYGKDYDFSKPFFSQFKELLLEVPLYSRSVNDLVNSDYCLNVGNLKDCYLVFDASYNENCAYSSKIEQSKDIFDCFNSSNCEFSYNLVSCDKCYKSFYCIDCQDSHDIWFSRNLRGCSNCFGCSNLRSKNYCIFNEQYDKDNYFSKLGELLGDYSRENLEKYNKNYFQSIPGFPLKYTHELKSVNCSGDYIYNSKNTKQSFYVNQAEDCKFCQFAKTVPGSKDCYDYAVWGQGAELIYESLAVGINPYSVKFGLYLYTCRNSEYCFMCASSQDLFGCVGLRNKQYCIFNKQYSKEEYEKLVPKIKEHMDNMPYIDKKGIVYKYGEFFPSEFSPFAYNELVTQEYIPLTREKALEQGYSWKDPGERNIKIDIKTEELKDNIKDVDDSILTQIIQCAHQGECNEQCTTAFKVIKSELEFYRQMKLPIPTLCPNCRHYQRIKQRNPLKLWKRKCQCNQNTTETKTLKYINTATHSHGDQPCPNEFETTYAPERPEIIYCEQCYQAEIV